MQFRVSPEANLRKRFGKDGDVGGENNRAALQQQREGNETTKKAIVLTQKAIKQSGFLQKPKKSSFGTTSAI